MPRLPSPPYRLDLWTNVAPAGGTRVAFLVDEGGRAVRALQRVRFMDQSRPSSLSFEVSPDFHAIASLAPNAAVVRLTRFVATGADSYDATVEEWRVARRSRTVRGGVGWYRVECVPIEEELLDRVLLREVSSGGLSTWGYSATERTPANVLADVDAQLPGWVQVGTVTPTAPVSIALAGFTATPRAVIDALVAQLAAQGVDAEFQFTLAADLASYRLELVPRIAGALAPVRVSTAENAPELEYDEDAAEQANAIVPATPDGVDLRELQLEILAIDAGTGWVTLKAIGGAPAPLVAVDGQFTAKYLHRELTGRNFVIVDASATPPRVRLNTSALASGFAAGERVSFRATEDNAGTRRAFGTRDRWSPAEVQSTLTGPPRINVDDLYGAGVFVTAANQFRDWVAQRSTLVAALPSGDFDHLTGILDLSSAPSSAPQINDWVWFDNGVEFVPGRVTAYNAGTHQVTLVPRYAGTQFTVSRTGITTARCYRPVSTPMWITASATTGDGQLTVEAFAGGTPSAGDVLEVYQPSQGARLVELTDPAAVAATRPKVATLTADCTGATNRIANADMAAWAGGAGDPPDGWSIESIVGTVTRTRTTDPTYTRQGGKSWKLDFGVGASAELFTPRIPIHPVPGMDQVAAAVCLLFTRFTGNVGLVVTLYRVTAAGVRTAIGDPIRVLPADSTLAADGQYKAALDSWYDAVLSNMPLADWADEQLQLGVARPAGALNPACTLYVDVAMLLQREGLPQEAEGGVRYVVGSDALPLLAAAQLGLRDRALPLVSFQGRFINVTLLDPVRYPARELVPGRDVLLTIPVVGVTRTVRLLGLAEQLDEPALPQVHLDRVRPNAGRMLAAQLAGRAATAPSEPVSAPSRPPLLSVRVTSDFTHTTISYSGSPRVTLQIDGGLEVDAPASPIVVAKSIPGGPFKYYDLFARSEDPGVQPVHWPVVIEPQLTVDPLAPAIVDITLSDFFAPGDGGGTFDLALVVDNEAGGTTYAVSVTVIPSSGNSLSGGGFSDTGLAIGDFPLNNVTGCAIAVGDQLQVTVTPSDPNMPPRTITVTVS